MHCCFATPREIIKEEENTKKLLCINKVEHDKRNWLVVVEKTQGEVDQLPRT